MAAGSVYKIVKLFLEFKAANNATLKKRRAQRSDLYKQTMLLKKYGPADLQARKEYWYKQIYFLQNLLKKQAAQQGVPSDEFTFREQLHDLVKNKKSLEQLLDFIIDDYQKRSEEEKKETSAQKEETVVESTVTKETDVKPEQKAATDVVAEQKAEPAEQQAVVKQTDVLSVIQSTLASGFVPVVNNAANANRDGSAKISRGSLEEAIARNTDSLFTMLCHFRDVDANHSVGPTLDVRSFQRRYLSACLTMMDDIMHHSNPDAYISSPEFLKKFLDAENSIFLDSQNTVYEVDAKEGFVSHAEFNDKQFANIGSLKDELKKEGGAEENPQKDPNIVLIYAAAPDRRKMEGAPYDKHCTLDPLLRAPNAKDTLRTMIEGGIKTQCEQALAMKAAGQKPSVIFMLPGCGAFGNPPKKTAKIFVEAIKSYQEKLEKAGVPFCIVEKNSKMKKILDKAWQAAPAPKPAPSYAGSLFRAAICLVAPSLYLRWITYKLNEQAKKPTADVKAEATVKEGPRTSGPSVSEEKSPATAKEQTDDNIRPRR